MLGIQLRGVVIHNLLCQRNRAWARGRCLNTLTGSVVVSKEIHHSARTKEPLIYSQGCGEFFLGSNFDGVQQLQSIGLAVVGDQVISWLFVSDALNN